MKGTTSLVGIQIIDPMARSRKDIVNLGFVINVIEQKQERDEAIRKAFAFTDRLLIVSAMIANEKHIAKFQPYLDGVVTSRNTFQKYYSQDALQSTLVEVLEEPVIALGNGVIRVFKDEALKTSFLQSKFKRQTKWQNLRGVRLSKEEKFRQK